MLIPERPRLQQELLEDVASAYGIAWMGEPIDLGGSSSLNVGVDRFVVRVHRSWLSVSRLEAMQAVRLALSAVGLPFVEPIATRADARWIRWQDHLVEVEHRVDGDEMDSWDAGAADEQSTPRVAAAATRDLVVLVWLRRCGR